VTGTATEIEISVLTPVLDEERFIRETVARMQAQDFPGRIEFLFMDGRSSDRTREILEHLAISDDRIVVLDNPARHTAAALNIGLRRAQGRYVARMDAHTLYPPHYLREAVRRLERGGTDWVCGPQIPHGVTPWSSRIAAALETSLGVGGSNRFGIGDANEEVEIDTGVFTGVWRYETLARHRGWDEGWPINQDSELAARVFAAGGRIVSLRSLGARYVPRDGLRPLARQYRRYGFYRAKTLLRHPQSARRSMLLAPGLVITAISALVPHRRIARPARLGLLIYLATITRTTARLAKGRPRELVSIEAIFPVMHLSWGAGFLVGLVMNAPRSRRRPRLIDQPLPAADRSPGTPPIDPSRARRCAHGPPRVPPEPDRRGVLRPSESS
jgi:glycosyltransferase involved in cell wall biosynthesis